MIHAAHASRYHWGEVGDDVNLARGEWQCSRVYAVLGRGEPALWHARRCVEIAEADAEARGLGPGRRVRGDGPSASPSPATSPARAEWKAQGRSRRSTPSPTRRTGRSSSRTSRRLP